MIRALRCPFHVLHRQRAFFECNGDPRAVGDVAGDGFPPDARFELALPEALEGPRPADVASWLTYDGNMTMLTQKVQQ